MDEKKAKAVIEAVLFAMGDSVPVAKLADAIDLDEDKTRKLATRLMEEYEKDERGISVIELDGAFQMCTKGDMYEYLIKAVKTPRKYVMTDALLETLSIIAYKQPVTRLDIERVRGVNCDHSVNRLIELDLVEEKGRMDAPGRPLLFGTTEEFLRSFGLSSLDDLPALDDEQLEAFRRQAEEEADADLLDSETSVSGDLGFDEDTVGI